jgi:hypothetical protein
MPAPTLKSKLGCDVLAPVAQGTIGGIHELYGVIDRRAVVMGERYGNVAPVAGQVNRSAPCRPFAVSV